MKTIAYITLAVVLASACSQAADTPQPTEPVLPEAETTEAPERLAVLSWGDLLSAEKPEPTHEIRIGESETDIVDLWLPETPGPHPVVLMVHGGCWQKSIADRTLMNYGAEDLRQRGLAVWNIEYRGVDEEGGGWPGTYQDVAKAADAMRDYAEGYDLDLARVAGTGHSAGGHLVMWLSARKNLPEGNAVYSPDPLPLVGVVNVGGLADLELSTRVTERSCMGAVLDDLTGPPDETRTDVFADTSPARLLPLGIPTVHLSGDLDRISPPGLATALTDKAILAGDTDVRPLIVKGNNHVDLIAPGTAAFEAQAEILSQMLDGG